LYDLERTIAAWISEIGPFASHDRSNGALFRGASLNVPLELVTAEGQFVLKAKAASGCGALFSRRLQKFQRRLAVS
jgi:hypothetical protein